jgi:hypothetical protein
MSFSGRIKGGVQKRKNSGDMMVFFQAVFTAMG